jgi:hypothetical protein
MIGSLMIFLFHLFSGVIFSSRLHGTLGPLRFRVIQKSNLLKRG